MQHDAPAAPPPANADGLASVYDARRANLRARLEERGAKTALAQAMNVTPANISHFLRDPGQPGARPIHEDLARVMEVALHLPPYELDKPYGPAGTLPTPLHVPARPVAWAAAGVAPPMPAMVLAGPALTTAYGKIKTAVSRVAFPKLSLREDSPPPDFSETRPMPMPPELREPRSPFTKSAITQLRDQIAHGVNTDTIEAVLEIVKLLARQADTMGVRLHAVPTSRLVAMVQTVAMIKANAAVNDETLAGVIDGLLLPDGLRYDEPSR